MSSVLICVKRRREKEPFGALGAFHPSQLDSKRARLSTHNPLFHYVGTAESMEAFMDCSDSTIFSHSVSSPHQPVGAPLAQQEDYKDFDTVLPGATALSSKARVFKATGTNDRFRVILSSNKRQRKNCSPEVNAEGTTSSRYHKDLRIIELEHIGSQSSDVITMNDVPMVEDGFLFDYYRGDLDDLWGPVEGGYLDMAVYAEDYIAAGGNALEDDTEESEDSNAENNWRNDYPEEEEEEEESSDDFDDYDSDDMGYSRRTKAIHSGDSDQEFLDDFERNIF